MLSEIQLELIEMLKASRIEEGAIIGIMLILKQKAQMEEMMGWMIANQFAGQSVNNH